VLEQYAAASGAFWEKVIADTGHVPYVEKPEEFAALLAVHLSHIT
jgi:pimeloyl-ACP methyl ester carboxylesterase